MSRRSSRTRAQPQSLADEQATHRYHAEDLLNLRRAMQQSLHPEEESESGEEDPPVEEASSSEEEEDEQENIPPHSAWVEHTHDITLPPFIDHPASILPRHRVMSEMGYLQCFLTPSLLSTIATNTNLYAVSKQAPAGWATSAEELWLFIAVHIFMGIVDLPDLHMYWEEGWRQGYVVKAFSRDRFTELLRYFHIAEPTPPGVRHTVIQKIAPLYDHCRLTFSSYFIPPREFAVDETMVGFKGRSAWKTVIKGKPTPIGYRVYTVASHGYLLNFDIYKGKGGYTTAQGVIHHTVINLVTPWSLQHRILFFDNLYTSPALCRHLLTIGIHSCGTARSNRKGLPSDIKEAMKSLRTGEYRAWQSGQLGCLVWCDKQPVLMLSTHHRVDDMVSVAQDRGPNHLTTIIKPQVSIDYNIHKCHVDTVDQLRQYYSMQRKSMKNWPSLAWWLIDMCIINSYTLWCLDTKATISQLDFRRALLQQLATTYPPSHTHQELSIPPHRSRPADGHWPKHVSEKRDCVHCSRKMPTRVRSRVVCKECDVHLCLDPCFEQYHTSQ
jgi:hypothetical protein